MSRRNAKNDDYQYYSARLIDLNEVLSDTNRELDYLDEEIDLNNNNNNNNNNNKRRSNHRRKSKSNIRTSRINNHYSPDEINNETIEFELRSSFSDNEDEHYERIRTKNSNVKKSKHCSRQQQQNLNDSVHELHRKVRDISFEQEKLADQVNSDRVFICNCEATCCSNKKACSKSNKKSSSELDSSFETRLENRLQQVYSKIKRKYETKLVNDDLKTVLEEFKKSACSTNNSKEDRPLIDNDIEKQKTQNELIMTKHKITELEDSKNNLQQQVQRLKEQLEKFENNQFNYQHQIQHPLHQNVPQITNSLNRNQRLDSTNEVVQTIDKYKTEIDQLNETVQNLKLSLKEKELEERDKLHEIRNLNDKNAELDQQNQSLRSDLEIALQKLKELAYETNQNSNQIQLYEDELNKSEQKREELKQDAQETIKLWKNKVKKLEKNLEKTRLELENMNQQNDFLKETAKNATAQFEYLTQENFQLKDMNKNLEHKLNSQGNEISNTKMTHEDLKSENSNLRNELIESQNSIKTFEIRNSDLLSEKSRLEDKLKAEETKSNDLYKKICQLQNEIEDLKNDKRESVTYIMKLESDCQNLRNALNNLERSEEETKHDLTNVSKQALQNKENFEEAIAKYLNQLQLTQCQLQKVKIETEEKIRGLQIQLVEEKSNNEMLKKRENEYINEIDELKTIRQRLDDELNCVQSRLDKFIRSDAEKSKILADYEDKYTRLLDEFNYQKSVFYNKETEYIKVLNLVEVDIDLLIGVLSTNLNKSYQPLHNLDESDKLNYTYLLIKHKTHWIAKSLEEMIQLKIKLQQNIVFLEHEIETSKKNSAYNIKAQGLFLKNLENQNNELLADRAIALKNMELLEQYLINLSESVKSHSIREIERTHHLFAIDNFMNLCNNQTLSDCEKDEIYKRFRLYKNTIDEIKSQLDLTQMNYSSNQTNKNEKNLKDRDIRASSSCSSNRSSSNSNSNLNSHYVCKQRMASNSNNQNRKQTTKSKPFK